MDWHIEGSEEQAKRVEDLFRANEQNEEFDTIGSAIEHLSLYSFRGRAFVKPIFEDGKLVLKKLNNWNVLMHNNKLWWNPSSAPAVDLKVLAEIPKEELAFCTSERPIDLPGILIYLRQLVGETKWS